MRNAKALMKTKLTWRVIPEPTGRYRSFARRGWPHAEYTNGRRAAYISSDTAYRGSLRGADVQDLSLTIHVAKHRHDCAGFDWYTLKVQSPNLPHAKERVQHFIDANPDWRPQDFDVKSVPIQPEERN